jgi:hypothetical protein
MDRLDEVLAEAGPLLRRVDEVLAAGGAPAEHAVWPELRRVRLLPGDAAAAVAELRPAAVADVVPELRAGARACVEAAAGLPEPGDWTGEAAEAYDDMRRRAAADLAGGGAVTLSVDTYPPLDAESTAAADVAAHVLRTIADGYAEAADLLHGSRDLATALAHMGAAPHSG